MSQKNRKLDQYSLADIFREMELELIRSMQETLSKHEAWEKELGFQWEQWQSAKLRSLNQYRVNNRKIIKSYEGQINDTIGEVLKSSYGDAYNNSLKLADEIMLDLELDSSVPLGDIEIPEENFFHVNDKKLDVVIDEMQKTFVNSEGVIMRKMDDTYRQVLDKAVLKLASGTTTIQKAIDDSTKEFLKKGIDSITYKNGRKVNIASYAEMYLRTANQQATFIAQGKVRDKTGNYFVVMSQHENCSPMCLPYQGTVMIDDVYTSISKDDAVQLARETGFGRLSTAMENHAFHPNCRHSLGTWYQGKSKIPKPFTEAENEKAVKRYKLEQEQRKLEAALREWKRIEAGSQSPDGIVSAKKMVRHYQQALREHIAANPNLRRNYWRERMEPQLEMKLEERHTNYTLPAGSNSGSSSINSSLPYEDVTQEWSDAIDTTKQGKIANLNHFEKEGKKYDSSNALLDYSFGVNEQKGAELLVNKFHDDVGYVPRVRPNDNDGKFISTPDIHFKNEYWELKTIEGSSSETIINRIKRGVNQSNQFVINISNKSELTDTMIDDQINYIYRNKRYSYVDKVIVMKNSDIYLIAQKKR